MEVGFWLCEHYKLLRRGWIATPGQLSEPSDDILRAGGIEMPLSEVVDM